MIFTKKRTLSLLTAIAMILGMAVYLPLGEQSVASAASAKISTEVQLQQIVETYKGKTATSAQMYNGIQCKGFACWVFKQLFGVYIGPYYASANYRTNVTVVDGAPVATEVGYIAPGKMSVDNAKKLLSKAYPGDLIQFRRANGGPHSAIVVSAEAKGVYLLDCNLDCKNTILYYFSTWEEIAKYNAFSLYHATNYEESHSFGKWTVVKAATCSADGQQKRVCDICGETETKAIKAIDHTYAEGKQVEPTCTAMGYTKYTCTVCGHIHKDNEIPALGHEYTDETVDPTCDSIGYTQHTCGVCGYSCKDSETSSLGHHFKEDITLPEDGEEISDTFTCVDCGGSYAYSLSADEEGDPVLTVTAEGYVPRSYNIDADSESVDLTVRFFRCGDINGDGRININDVVRAAAYIKGANGMDSYEQAVADVNGDGAVDAQDVSMLAASVKGFGTF